MPILSTDIKYYFSGGAGNANPNASLGGVISTTETTASLFDDVPSAEATAGTVEYRCIYVKNTNGTLTLIAPKVFIQTNTPSTTTTVAIGLGTAAINGTEQTVANETTAPAGVSFSEPANFAAGLSIGDLAVGATRSIWIRRTVTAGTAAVADSFTIAVQGDSNP